jgi:hypothetical protein
MAGFEPALLTAQKFYQMKYEVTLLYGIIQKLSEP